MEQAEFNTKDSCKIALAIGYRVYQLVLCYTALYTCFNKCLQSVPTGTGLHSLLHLLQQLVTECTDWYWLHSLVHFNLPVSKSTNRVLATQSLLYRASPQLVT